MNIVVAQSAGFCWGVRQAMDAALEASARWGSRGPVQTLGPLIHNPQALSHLSERGITEVDSAREIEEGTVVVRAHGIPLPELRLLKARHRQQSLRLINGTCPEVAKVQARIKRYASRGYFVVLLGTRGHAEVVAHESYASNGCAVVSSLIEAQQLTFSADQRVLVIAQTTFLTVDFEEIAAHFRNRVRNCVVLNTICKDTGKRQHEAETLCRRSDYLIVIGGRASNNTRHLMELATAAGKPVQWVESSTDLDLSVLRNMPTVGVLAGASTPTWTVDEVIETLRQAGQPSRWRLVTRFAQTLDLPFTAALAVLTWLVHRFLNWPTGWMGPVLPAAFHLACRAGLPYLHPHHLAAKGQVQEAFLIRHRRGLLLLAGMLGLATHFSALFLGPWVLGGLLFLGAWLTLYPAREKHIGLQRLPAVKDLGDALPPTLLAVGLPALQLSSPLALPIAAALLCVFFSTLAWVALRHRKAFREDRIVGREILAVAIGSRATRWVAAALLLVSGILLGWLAAPHLAS